MWSKCEDDFEDISNVPYASALGRLMHAMICTRLDIAKVVGVLSSFMSNTSREHWNYVKSIYWYLCGTFDYCLVYFGTNNVYKH